MLTEALLKKLNSLQTKAIALGAVATIAALVLGALIGDTEHRMDRIFQPLIIAYFFWFALGAGSLAVVMLHHLCGGAWSFLLQRICEAGSRTLPFFAVSGVFILLGAVYTTNIYPWTDQEYMLAHHAVALKHKFLNPSAYTIDYFVCFAIWLALMAVYNSWSAKLDATGDHKYVAKMKQWAAPGLILYVLSITAAATHWTMSLEPEWFSTIYGMWTIAGHGLTVMSFGAVALFYLKDEPPIKKLIQTKHFHHIGNFMLGFTIFWAYLSFSQFLIIWNGNLSEEIGWYLNRSGNGLTAISVFLMVFHWFLPMMLLLMRVNKKNITRLRTIAYYVLAVRVVDVYWNIAPSYDGHARNIGWGLVLSTALAIVGFGGIWLWLFLAQLKKRPIISKQDPREDSLFFHDEAHSHA